MGAELSFAGTTTKRGNATSEPRKRTPQNPAQAREYQSGEVANDFQAVDQFATDDLGALGLGHKMKPFTSLENGAVGKTVEPCPVTAPGSMMFAFIPKNRDGNHSRIGVD